MRHCLFDLFETKSYDPRVFNNVNMDICGLSPKITNEEIKFYEIKLTVIFWHKYGENYINYHDEYDRSYHIRIFSKNKHQSIYSLNLNNDIHSKIDSIINTKKLIRSLKNNIITNDIENVFDILIKNDNKLHDFIKKEIPYYMKYTTCKLKEEIEENLVPKDNNNVRKGGLKL